MGISEILGPTKYRTTVAKMMRTISQNDGIAQIGLQKENEGSEFKKIKDCTIEELVRMKDDVKDLYDKGSFARYGGKEIVILLGLSERKWEEKISDDDADTANNKTNEDGETNRCCMGIENETDEQVFKGNSTQKEKTFKDVVIGGDCSSQNF